MISPFMIPITKQGGLMGGSTRVLLPHATYKLYNKAGLK